LPELLELAGVVTGYGSAPVLHGVDLAVREGELAVILGANGAGKTTTLRATSSLLRLWKGAVRFDGVELGKLRPERVARMGLGLVPAAPGVFLELSVLDNLYVGAFALHGGRRAALRSVEAVLADFPRLAKRCDQRAESLSGGEQRMLAVARALVGEPRLLLLDEASMGLSPTMVGTVLRMLAGIRDRGVTVCMVEQSPAALDVADRAHLMAKGRVVESATGARLDTMRARALDTYLGRARPPRAVRGT
jgi:branched-chain amino acid transport system ATP-binding protein